MQKRLVIWDWNGTLIDDADFCYDIANRMRVERGMAKLSSLDVYRSLFCFPVETYYKNMGYTFEKETYEDISVEFVDLYYKGYAACPLRAHALETMQALEKRGYTQVLLSATGQARLTEQVETYGLTGRFFRVLGTGNNLGSGKADLARAFLSESGIPPEQTLFIGDTDHDVLVARSVGADAALLTGGHQNADRLYACGVNVLTDVREALSLLDAFAADSKIG